MQQQYWFKGYEYKQTILKKITLGTIMEPRTPKRKSGFQNQILKALALAERVGFEPTVSITPHTISSRAP